MSTAPIPMVTTIHQIRRVAIIAAAATRHQGSAPFKRKVARDDMDDTAVRRSSWTEYPSPLCEPTNDSMLGKNAINARTTTPAHTMLNTTRSHCESGSMPWLSRGIRQIRRNGIKNTSGVAMASSITPRPEMDVDPPVSNDTERAEYR